MEKNTAQHIAFPLFVQPPEKSQAQAKDFPFRDGQIQCNGLTGVIGPGFRLSCDSKRCIPAAACVSPPELKVWSLLLAADNVCARLKSQHCAVLCWSRSSCLLARPESHTLPAARIISCHLSDLPRLYSPPPTAYYTTSTYFGPAASSASQHTHTYPILFLSSRPVLSLPDAAPICSAPLHRELTRIPSRLSIPHQTHFSI